MSLKKALSALALGLAFVSSASANTLTYQGVTFNTWAIDADSMGLSILNAPARPGNWTGASFLKRLKSRGSATSPAPRSARRSSLLRPITA